jgi:hypothetical protein
MVGTKTRRATVARQRWHIRSSWHRSPSILSVLERLDDDPVLFCDCAEGAAHSCG